MARVLLVEDQTALRLVLSELLREGGHEVLAAASGSCALGMLERRPPPDVVVMDLLMPKVGGRGVLAQMRADPRWRALPVVLMTGADGNSDDFPPPGSYQALLRKPFEVEDLLAAVDACIAGPGGGQPSGPG